MNRNKHHANEYIPGICNLGRKEILRRYLQVIAGLIITIVLIAILQAYHYPSIWRISVIAPLFYTTICFLQAREKFCVVFGINGVYNFSDERKLIKVKDGEYRMKDRRKALKIFFISVLIAIVITVVYFYLPV